MPSTRLLLLLALSLAGAAAALAYVLRRGLPWDDEGIGEPSPLQLIADNAAAYRAHLLAEQELEGEHELWDRKSGNRVARGSYHDLVRRRWLLGRLGANEDDLTIGKSSIPLRVVAG